MPFTKLLPTSIDLAQNFAFTGSVSGAGGGKLLQTVTEKQSTQVHISSTSYSNVFSKAITPTLNTSKILVLVSGGRWGMYSSNTYEGYYSVRRDSTEIMHGLQVIREIGNNIASGTVSVSYLDSPTTSSSVTYSLDAKSTNSSKTVSVCNAISPITMTLMEIGA